MFLLQQMALDSTAYNVPNLFSLAPSVTRDALARAFAALAARHDAFRCAFALDGTQVAASRGRRRDARRSPT